MQSLKQFLNDDKNKRIKEEVEEIEQEYKETFIKLYRKLAKTTNNKPKKDIYEEILDTFKADLDRFITKKEKIAYLKSLGFAVNEKDEENLENK